MTIPGHIDSDELALEWGNCRGYRRLTETQSDIDPESSYWLSSSCGRIEMKVPGKLILDLAGPGPVDEAAAYWAGVLDWSTVDEEALIADLKEYGCDWEYTDEQANRERFLWTASGNVYDSDEPDQHKA